MDFFKKFKRNDSDEDEKSSNESPNENNEFNLNLNASEDSDFSNDLWDNLFSDELENDLKYLNDLIQNSKEKFILPDDVTASDDDFSLGYDTILINNENFIIDGQGHTIDGNNRPIGLDMASKNITIKNLIFKNVSGIEFGFIRVHPDCTLKVINCEFHDFKGKYGLAFQNYGHLEVYDSRFYGLNGSEEGGAINIQKNTYAKISNCKFYHTSSRQGGVFMNWGTLVIEDSTFKNSLAKGSGGICINEKGSTLKITKSKFCETASNTGGAISNLGKATISDSKFINNQGNNGGAIFNFQRETRIRNCEFIGNSAYEGSALCNMDMMEIEDCTFENNDNFRTDVIVNKDDLKVSTSKFNNNNSQSLISNSVNSKISVSYCDFVDNFIKNYAVFNEGEECYINETTFKNNTDYNKPKNICNHSNSYLNSIELKDSNNDLTIYNSGMLDVKIPKDEIENCIDNHGTVNYIHPDESGDPRDDAKHHNFSDLENLIDEKLKHPKESDEILINLNEDIILEKSEIEFYGGGIVLEEDDITIDGNGHCIDANNLSRVFYVVGKNITLKNITFKNGKIKNDFDKYIDGGGALRVVEGASLTIEDCRFEDSISNDQGGAIMNNGDLTSERSVFINNKSQHYGGAIYNRSIFTSKSDTFENNSSKCGGAAYNLGKIDFNKVQLTNNKSTVLNEIFNCGIIDSADSKLDEFTYDVGLKQSDYENSISFKEFSNQIDANSDIALGQDVVFNHETDSNFKSGIRIQPNRSITVDGNGHCIDANHMAGLLNITSGNPVCFKNIIFKNASSWNKSLIRNRNRIHFENCKFINNKSFNGSALIETGDLISFRNCIFSNNFSKADLIHMSKDRLDFDDSLFICNFSQNNLLHNEREEMYVSKCSDYLLRIANSEFLANNSLNSMISNDEKTEISGCDFIDNISESRESVIYNHLDDSLMTIYDSKFKFGNSKYNGGFVNNMGKLKIDLTKFEESHCKYGGSISNGINGTLEVSDCDFSKSYAERGGAVSNLGHAEFYDTRFHECDAETYGAVIDSLSDSQIKIIRCMFCNNNKSDCPLIENSGRMTIEDSAFSNNFSSNKSSLICDHNIFSDITNCRFDD